MTTIATPEKGYRPVLAPITELRAFIQAEIAAERQRMEDWRASCSRPSA